MITNMLFVVITIATVLAFKHICKELAYMRSGEIYDAEIINIKREIVLLYTLRIKDGRMFTIKSLPLIYRSKLIIGDIVKISVLHNKALLIDSMR